MPTDRWSRAGHGLLQVNINCFVEMSDPDQAREQLGNLAALPASKEAAYWGVGVVGNAMLRDEWSKKF